MPRSRKKAKTETPVDAAVDAQYERLAEQIKPFTSPVEELKAEIPGITTAAELPTPPRADAEPPPRELVVPETNPDRHRPTQHRNSEEHELPTFAEKVAANRASFRPVPQDFVNLDSYPEAGLKLNRSRDKAVLAILFAEDRLPSRDEKDALQIRGLNYDPQTRQWTRRDAENPAANAIDAKDMAAELAEGRKERGR